MFFFLMSKVVLIVKCQKVTVGCFREHIKKFGYNRIISVEESAFVELCFRKKIASATNNPKMP